MLWRKMAKTLAIVGAGRVGQTLGRALAQRGYRIEAVVELTPQRAQAAVRFMGSGQAMSSSRADKLRAGVAAAETMLVSVPDPSIRPVAHWLASLGRESWRGKVVLHTSGSRSARELAPLKRLGAHCGSFHPLFPFPRPLRSFPKPVFFGIEGDAKACQRARRLARALGGIPIPVSARGKVLYHAAGALASGHLMTLIDLGTRALVRAGVPRKQTRRALLPLIRSTIAQYERLGEKAWTGPLARADSETVQKHLLALRKLPAHFREVYATLGRVALTLYTRGQSVGRSRLEELLKRAE